MSLAAGTGTSHRKSIIDALGLEPVLGALFKSCSLGSRRRVMLAAALLTRPEYLLLDEPMNGLDPNTVQWLSGYLRELSNGQGMGILLSSHLLDEQKRICDQLVIMGSGRVLANGSVEQITGGHSKPCFEVGTLPGMNELLALHLQGLGWRVERTPETCTVYGSDVHRLAADIFEGGFPVAGMQQRVPSLHQVYLELTGTHQALRSAAKAEHPELVLASKVGGKP